MAKAGIATIRAALFALLAVCLMALVRSALDGPILSSLGTLWLGWCIRPLASFGGPEMGWFIRPLAPVGGLVFIVGSCTL